MTNCKNCGAPIPAGAGFCTSCGARVPGEAAHTTYEEARTSETQQTTYTAPEQPVQQTVYMQNMPEEEVSIGEWMLTMFLAVIPIVGFIMLLVWAFSGNTTPSKKNWAIATLIWSIIGIVLSFFLGAAIVGLIASISS